MMYIACEKVHFRHLFYFVFYQIKENLLKQFGLFVSCIRLGGSHFAQPPGAGKDFGSEINC